MVAINTSNIERSTKKKKFNFFLLIRESNIFLLFSFFSCFLPIFYCLVASLIKPNGSQAVMAIGYVAPFLLAFLQISFTISMIIFSRLNLLKEQKFKWKNDSTIFSGALWMSIFIGAIMSIFYIISTFLYIYFSVNKPNTQATLYYGLEFLLLTIVVVFFFPVYTTSTFYIYSKNKLKAFLSILITFISIGIFSLVLEAFTNMKVYGIALGTIFGLAVGLIYNYLIIKFNASVIIYYPTQIRHFNILIIRVIFRESFTLISLSLFKGVAIVAISFAIPLTINGFVPLGYQMSRVIWFNMMYFIPFVGIGFGEAIRAHYLNFKNHDENCYLNHTWKSDMKIMLITFSFSIVLCIAAIFMVKPLAYVYTKNDHNPFKNRQMPQIEGWGVPTLPPIEFIQLEKLQEIKWIDFPELKPLTGKPIIDAIIKAENLLKIKNWTTEMIANNKEEYKHMIENFSNWISWFNQSNDDGITISQFIEQKYKLDGLFKAIYDFITNKKPIDPSLLDGLKSLLKNGMSYFVYLWLFSTTNPIVTESFISLRPIIDYHNVLLENQGVIDLLRNSNYNQILTSLFLLNNSFEAKSMIYICIFSLGNSIWAILLQTNQRNFKYGMKWWIMILIYGLCIGGLVTFGVLFGVTFKDSLGNANPFQYLDAWTFPLLIIFILAISIVSLISYESWKHLKKIQNQNKSIKETKRV